MLNYCKIPIFQGRLFTPSNEYLTDIMENRLKLFSRLFFGFFRPRNGFPSARKMEKFPVGINSFVSGPRQLP